MKEFLLKLLSPKSDVSMMRFMSLVSLLAAIVIAVVSLYANKDLSDVAMLCGAFLVPAFGGKAIQAKIEQK